MLVSLIEFESSTRDEIKRVIKIKRVGNLYEKIYDMENLKLAHKNARKGKGWYKEVQWVNEHEEECL